MPASERPRTASATSRSLRPHRSRASRIESEFRQLPHVNAVRVVVHNGLLALRAGDRAEPACDLKSRSRLAGLPKTRSGKIMRRLLCDLAEGRAPGDVTTLRAPAVMEQLETKVKELQAAED